MPAGLQELEEIPAPGPELTFAKLHDMGQDSQERGGPYPLGKGYGGEEGGLRVDLGDEEVVDVEELRQLFHGQILLHRAVVPFAGGFGAFRSVRLAHVEIAWRKGDAGGGRRGEGMRGEGGKGEAGRSVRGRKAGQATGGTDLVQRYPEPPRRRRRQTRQGRGGR